MAQLSVSLNGRNYRLTCGDGEEERLQELAAFVSQHLGALSNEFGRVGDDRLMVMSLLMLAELIGRSIPCKMPLMMKVDSFFTC